MKKSSNVLLNVVVSCPVSPSQKRQLQKLHPVVVIQGSPIAQEKSYPVASSEENCENNASMETENDVAIQLPASEEKTKSSESAKLDSLIAEVENRLSQALWDLPEESMQENLTSESEEESSSEDGNEDDGEEEEEEEEKEGEEEAEEGEEKEDGEEEDERQSKIQEVLRKAQDYEHIESEFGVNDDEVILIEDDDEEVEERKDEKEEKMEEGEEKENREIILETDEVYNEDSSCEITLEEEAPKSDLAKTEETKETDNPCSVFEKPGPKSAKTASAFCSDTLEKYLEENAALNRPTQDAISEYFEPDVDEIDGHVFMSFASREALRKHQAVHRVEASMNSGKGKGRGRGKGRGGKAHHKAPTGSKTDIFRKLKSDCIESLGFNLRPHFGKRGMGRRKAGGRLKMRRGLSLTDSERQPSKGLIYGRRYNGRFASKQLVHYHESKERKIVRRRPCDLRFDSVPVTSSMAAQAVSALQLSNRPVCEKDGCRYGCICHLCDSVYMDAHVLSPPSADLPPCGQSHCRLGCVCDSLNNVTQPQRVRSSYVVEKNDDRSSSRRSSRVTQRPSYANLANPKSPFFQEQVAVKTVKSVGKKRKRPLTQQQQPIPVASSTPNVPIGKMYPMDRELNAKHIKEVVTIDNKDGKSKQVMVFKVHQEFPENEPSPEQSSDDDIGPLVGSAAGAARASLYTSVRAPRRNSRKSSSPPSSSLLEEAIPKVRLVLLQKHSEKGEKAGLALLEVVSYSDWEDIAVNLYNFLVTVMARKLTLQSASIKNFRITMLKQRARPLSLPLSLQKRLGREQALPDIRILLSRKLGGFVPKRSNSTSNPAGCDESTPPVKNPLPPTLKASEEEEESSGISGFNSLKMSTPSMIRHGKPLTIQTPSRVLRLVPETKNGEICAMQQQSEVANCEVIDVDAETEKSSIVDKGGSRVLIHCKDGSMRMTCVDSGGEQHMDLSDLGSTRMPCEEEVIELSSEDEEDDVDITSAFISHGKSAARELRDIVGIEPPAIRRPADHKKMRKQSHNVRSSDPLTFQEELLMCEDIVDDNTPKTAIAADKVRKYRKISRERRRRSDISCRFQILAKFFFPDSVKSSVPKHSILLETINHIKFLESRHSELMAQHEDLTKRKNQLTARLALMKRAGDVAASVKDETTGEVKTIREQFAEYLLQNETETLSVNGWAVPSDKPSEINLPEKATRRILKRKDITQTIQPPRVIKRSDSLDMDISSIIDNVMETTPQVSPTPDVPKIKIEPEEEVTEEVTEEPPAKKQRRENSDVTIPDIGVKVDTDTENVVKVVQYKNDKGETFKILLKEAEESGESSYEEEDEEKEEEHNYAVVKSAYQQAMTNNSM
ncbi:hypothetical protein CAPTEDRAFT_224028 [Capitella teleta]|uniref:BHLH domain-containing protein n=1 Tax=Capitella teleta TaxID=283909 RepID=R7U9T2_CAPTE|nr:hypothetical protein CAPTEDRAFT_224028 [Capitella teleta]|eukprot:ELU02749.1 hypothetical protein CAPTEDRAFT_224028 [Capitella teleta]